MPFIQFQFRRGTSTEWNTSNPVLANGELGIETNTNKFKLGNGSSTWTSLPYGGVQGVQGTQGVQGLQGVQGPQGTQGTQGPQGTQGVQGLQGVQGPQGTQGVQGTQGPQGTQGVQGTIGLQGLNGLFAGQGVQGVQGIQGSVGINTRTVSYFNAASNQTTFNIVGGYTSNRIDVFRNGVKLQRTADYTDTSGTDVILAVGASDNDLIEVVTYSAIPVMSDVYTQAQSDSRYVNNQKLFAVNWIFGS